MKKLALIGNPNTGKSSLFNILTGMNQHVGNFPGVTVDKKTGIATLPSGEKIKVYDLPGTYSIFPRSTDEQIVTEIFTNPAHPDFPDVVAVVADASNLERNLLLFTQLYDIGLPLVLVLTMNDVAEQRNLQLEKEILAAAFEKTPVVMLNARTGNGVEEFKQVITHFKKQDARVLFHANNFEDLRNNTEGQTQDATNRFEKIKSVLASAQKKNNSKPYDSFTRKLDRLATHRIFGYIIFMVILLVVFQFIYRFASYPMDWMDGAFTELSQWTKANLPAGAFTDLLAEGVVQGIGGVVVFVPQIALLFFFLSVLEETGYMARVVFMMDKLVRPFGLNGKSVVPLVSSVACAIPGIMATRNINSWKERIITIMVAPLMSCSARLPVFTLLVALVIPDTELFGFIQLKGLVLFSLYTLGLVSALIVAWVMKHLLRSDQKSFLLLELPTYQFPRWKQILLTLWEKVRVFVFDAGKVIVAISIILWALASYGPTDRLEKARMTIEKPTAQNAISPAEYETKIAAVELENSYIGIVGKAIEPVITPLGFDWKIGIALITSFAAREVFVGSMATIYSVGQDFEHDTRLIDRLRSEKNSVTGTAVYNLASGASLMVFYVFAMQCMATLAVVKRETKSWKWPLLQLVYMGVLAYLAAWLTFNLLN